MSHHNPCVYDGVVFGQILFGWIGYERLSLSHPHCYFTVVFCSTNNFHRPTTFIMSKPSEWTTTYSSVYRDRRRYVSPNPDPSDPSFAVRTQAYYGPKHAISEHHARTAEAEARTGYGAYEPRNQSSRGDSGVFNKGASQSWSGSSSAAYQGEQGQQQSIGLVRYNHPVKDLWTHPILPHTGSLVNGVPVYGSSGVTTRALFHNGFNNGYAGEVQYVEPQGGCGGCECSGSESARRGPQAHIPGYQGHIRGIQFVHGNVSRSQTKC